MEQSITSILPESQDSGGGNENEETKAAFEIPEPAQNSEPEKMEMRDKRGELFNPEIHQADENGRPVYRKGKRKGTFARKRGRKPETGAPSGAPSGHSAQGPKMEDFEAGAESGPNSLDVTAAELTAISLLPARAIWRVEIHSAQESNVERAMRRVCERFQLKEPTPTMDLAIALGMVYGPLIAKSATKPENLTRFEKLKIWAYRKFKSFKKGGKDESFADMRDHAKRENVSD